MIIVSSAYILFELAETTYGIAAADVQQMEMIDQITPVPNTAPDVEGVVMWRGQVIPVLNLRRRFGLESMAVTLRSRLVIVIHGARRVGVLVDSCREFITLDPQNIHPPPAAIGDRILPYLDGVAHLDQRLVFLLNPETIITHHHGSSSEKNEI